MAEQVPLGQLLQFINQPQARSPIPSLPSFGTSDSQGNKYEQQMLAQDRLKRKNAKHAGSLLQQIYGNQKGEQTPYDQEGDLFPGEEPIPGLSDVASADTGMFDESVPFQRRLMEMNKGMGTSGDPMLFDQWSKNQGNMQGSMLQNIAAGGRNDADNQAKMDIARFKQDHPKMSTYGRNAADAGFTEGTQPFKDQVLKQMRKQQFEPSGEKMFGSSELVKWMKPDGEPIASGNLNMAKRGEIVLRDKTSATDAAKIAGLESSIASLDEIDKLMFLDNGDINEGVVKDMWLKDLSSSAGGFLQKLTEPFVNNLMSPQGQIVSAAMENGIQAITRLETGAEMPAGELNNTKSRFQPTPGEDPRVSIWKYNMYKKFLRSAKDYLRPAKKNSTLKDKVARINSGIDQVFAENPVSKYLSAYGNKGFTPISTSKVPGAPNKRVLRKFNVGDVIKNPNGPEQRRFTGLGDPTNVRDRANWEDF